MKTTNIISAIAASLLLAACGGASTTTNTTEGSASASSTTPSNKVLKGYYVDSSVEGVEFNCTTADGATQSGTTDANGTFTFEENQTCTFTIGDVVLREVNASSLEDKVTIFEDNTRVAQFLQTLDQDGNASNGIEILPEAHEVVKERNMTKVPQNDAELEDVKDDLKVKAPERYRGDIVSEQDAREHLGETRQRIETNNQRTQEDVESTRRAERGSDREGTSTSHEDANQTREANQERGSDRDTMGASHEDSNQTREASQERTAEQEAMRETHEDTNQTREQNSDAVREEMEASHEDENQTRGSNSNRPR